MIIQMSEEIGDRATNAARQECMSACPEFCTPVLEHLQFLNREYGFKKLFSNM